MRRKSAKGATGAAELCGLRGRSSEEDSDGVQKDISDKAKETSSVL
jgi:hypothetical protein